MALEVPAPFNWRFARKAYAQESSEFPSLNSRVVSHLSVVLQSCGVSHIYAQAALRSFDASRELIRTGVTQRVNDLQCWSCTGLTRINA